MKVSRKTNSTSGSDLADHITQVPTCYSPCFTCRAPAMKTLNVVIRAELEIPDDWELVEHRSGALVLKIGDQFVDFDITPLATKSAEPDAEWSDSDVNIVNEVLDTVVGLDAEMEINTLH